MKKIAVSLMLLLASFAVAQNGNNHDANGQGKDSKDQKDQKAPDTTYHSPFDADISKSSFGQAKGGAFSQGSVTNASPQRAAGTPAPTIDFHHKQASHSPTTHDAKADAKANAKAPYDPGQYKAKAPAKLPQ